MDDICFKEETNFTSFATVLIMAAFRLYNTYMYYGGGLGVADKTLL
jgi:hypothetical protein